jgi:Zn-dependent peptidase ImmA (M78 family)
MSQGTAPKKKIRQYARGALNAAGVEDVSRVPVDAVAAAVNLRRRDLFELGEDIPKRFRDVVRKLKGNVLGLLAIDKREYFIDRSLPLPRQRFTEAHEIGHDALPWHEGAFWADDDTTLDRDTKDVLESEANQFSAELLFGAGRFTKHADSYAPGLDVALLLANEYGVSAHAALRKYVEDSEHAVAVIALGRYPGSTGSVKHISTQSFDSDRFRQRYGRIHTMVRPSVGSTTYPELATLLDMPNGSAPVSEITLDTMRGQVKFAAEGFTNGRLNFVVLHKATRLSGQKLRLISADGFELLPG